MADSASGSFARHIVPMVLREDPLWPVPRIKPGASRLTLGSTFKAKPDSLHARINTSMLCLEDLKQIGAISLLARSLKKMKKGTKPLDQIDVIL